jgi:hypothetical protein
MIFELDCHKVAVADFTHPARTCRSSISSYCGHSSKRSFCRHTKFSPVHTIIANTDSLLEPTHDESSGYFELASFSILNIRTGGAVE